MPWSEGKWINPVLKDRRQKRAWWNPRILWISIPQLIQKLREKFNG